LLGAFSTIAMPQLLGRQFIEFARTIRFSHTLFALPFALGTALVAEPPVPNGWALALLVACMVAARTASMGMNRVADAALDARNPRTAGRAIPAGRLSRRAAIVLMLASVVLFVWLAWLFLPLRGNWWPGALAPAFIGVLLGYSYTKRFTILAHWVLGLSLGLAPVGAWIALRGRVEALPVLIGAAVLFWTAGFDILYSLQDVEVDRRDGLHSVPARFGFTRALAAAATSHLATVTLMAAAIFVDARRPGGGAMGLASRLALLAIAVALVVQHRRAHRSTPEEIGRAFTPLNILVSLVWLAGIVVDVALGANV
jgi:4-hydroxybenzoate polyprenyltransferase